MSLVTEQIETMILQGKLREGDQLPPEHELCRQFGVSRTVVREAIARLSAKNLLDVRGGGGGGIVISAPTAEHVSDSLRFLMRSGMTPINHEQVLEVRRLLEVEIAGLAAERRTDADIAAMATNLTQSEAMRNDREQMALLDVEFHRRLAIATQNSLFVLLLDSMSEALLAMRRLGYATPGNPDRALYHHRVIFSKVFDGRVDDARLAMRAHLEEAEQTLRMVHANNNPLLTE